MTRSYSVYVDWDNDGYWCKGVSASDPLNLIPDPVLLRAETIRQQDFDLSVYTELFLAPRYEETEYGLMIHRVEQSAGAIRQLVIGRNRGFYADPAPSGRANFPVTPEVEHVASVYAKMLSTTGTNQVKFSVYADGDVLLEYDYPYLTINEWVRLELPFTPSAGITDVWLGLWSEDHTIDISFDATGFMINTGATAPPFNAGSAFNAYDDVTSRIRSTLAFSDGLGYDDNFGQPAELQAGIDNRDGFWNPIDTDSPVYGAYRRGLGVRVAATLNGTEYTLWRGTLSEITLTGEDGYDATGVLVAKDAIRLMTETEFTPIYQENVTVDQALAVPFEKGAMVYPVPGQFGIWGVSRYQQNAAYFENRITSFQTGKTTLPYAGDNLDRGYGINLQQYLRQILACECGGRFFWGATIGRYVFHHRLRDAIAEAIPFEDTFTATDGNLEGHQPDTGTGTWDVLGDASFTITSNRARFAAFGTGTARLAVIDSGRADQYTLTATIIPTTTFHGVTFRGTSDGAQFFMARWDGSVVGLYLYNPTVSTLDTTALVGTPSSGYTISIEVDGEDISVTVNGVTASATSAIGTENTYIGIRGGAAGDLLDDLKMTPLNRSGHEINHVWSPGAPLDAPPLKWIWADDIVNHVDVRYEKREIGAAGTVVWEYDNLPLAMSAGNERRIVARYTSTDTDLQIATKDGIAPVAATDFVCNYTDGAMENANDILNVFVTFNANTAEVRLKNTSSRPISITTLQLRGTPVTTLRAQEVTSRDAVSILENGLHKLTIDVASINTEDFAQQYADVRAHERAQPLKLLKSIAFNAAASTAAEAAVTRATVGDLLNVNTGDGVQLYIVLGRQHVIDLAGSPEIHIVTYTVKSVIRTSVALWSNALRGVYGESVYGL